MFVRNIILPFAHIKIKTKLLFSIYKRLIFIWYLLAMAKSLFNIFEWSASLYDNKRRRWLYGTLEVLADEIVFTKNDSDKDEKLIEVPFGDLIDVKKSTTGLVFGAIYLLTKKNEKIWFSSLQDRESVYGALKHFWKACLFQESGSRSKNSRSGKTEMGQKMLAIVKDSEETLSKAAVQLYDQGKQIDNAIGTMYDLHNDLDVAENLMEDLDSWFGKWRLPAVYKTVDPVIINMSDIPEVFEFEILFTKLETGRANTRHVGYLRISKDGLTILNQAMKTEFHFRWADVSQLRVVTPWELMVVRYQIGKPDLLYSLVSANMAAILRVLDSCAKYKLKYDTPPERTLCTKHKSADKKDVLYKTDEGTKEKTLDRQPVNPSGIMGIDQIQIGQSKQVVSESEADEISRALSGLKSLALAVQEEGSVQNENLDSLTLTVDIANQRLKDTEKKIKKMTK